ncbi:ferric/cupric-chelate reductase [Chytriomyces hyalinus]|nr:ferric/cupric-chelate reductase [Chytriomyces hyalinus]
MPYTPAQLVFGAVSLAAFPASLVVVYYMMDNKSWCLADHCIAGAIAPQIRYSLAVFYGFLALTAATVVASKKVPGLRRVLSKSIIPGTTITVGEIGWFIGVLAICCVGLPIMYWRYNWDRRAEKFIPQYSYTRLVYHTLMMASGDCLAVIMGFQFILPSKNSFFATFLDLPYTSMVRVHTWIGFTTLLMVLTHFVAFMLSYNLTKEGIAKTLFASADGKAWGKGAYVDLLGFSAFWVLVIITASSFAVVRRKCYNVFYYLHFLTYPFAVMIYLHAQSAAYFLMPGLFMYILDVIIRACTVFSSDTVTKVIVEEYGYITVTVATTKARNAKPGQFMRVNVPSVSMFEYHPWSIVHSDERSATFLFAPSVKANEWSTLVAEQLKSYKQGGHSTFGNVSVVLQGPYGKEMDMTRYGQMHNASVFYVGGTGLSACVAAINTIIEENDVKVMPTKVVLCWSSRSGGTANMSLLQDWIKTGKVVLELYETSGADLDKSEQTLLQPSSAGGHSALVQRGRPTLANVLDAHVKPLIASGEMLVRVGVFICGPAGLTRDGMRQAAKFAQENKSACVVEVEAESYQL